MRARPGSERNGLPAECEVLAFALSIEGPERLAGSPGARLRATYDCVLTQWGSLLRGEGAQGWVISVWSDGLWVSGATTEGTIVNEITRAGFLRTDFASHGNRKGFASAVLRSAHGPPVALPTDGPTVICRFTVEDEAPTPEGMREAQLRYEDGMRIPGATPARNAFTLRGHPNFPVGRPLSVTVTSLPSPFRRGDANGDGALNSSDSIYLFRYLIQGAEAPSCLKAADADDSGSIDLTDGIYANLFLFAGGRSIPSPGPFACGVDPTSDAMTCLEYSVCE